MTDAAALRRAKTIGERAELALTPEERAERERAGRDRRQAMRQAGVKDYRSLVGPGLERRP